MQLDRADIRVLLGYLHRRGGTTITTSCLSRKMEKGIERNRLKTQSKASAHIASGGSDLCATSGGGWESALY